MGTQSWSLEKFKKEFGVYETMRVMGYTSRQAVYAAIGIRNIRITLTEDNRLEAWEAKLIGSVEVLGDE